MGAGDVTFALLAANPIGGLLIAVPFGLLKQHYPLWLVVALATPLAYLQVFAIDLGWTLLTRIPSWHRFLERRRSPRVEQLVASGGGFWITFLATPFVGPWMVMSFMRWAHVPQRRVAVPILLSLLATALGLAVITVLPTLILR